MSPGTVRCIKETPNSKQEDESRKECCTTGLTPYYPILLKETGDKSKDSHLFFSFAGNLLDLSKT